MKKFIIMCIICSLIALVFVGCGETEDSSTSESVAQVTIDTSDMFTDRDSETDYDEEEATNIVLSSSDVTITEEGVYVLSGTLSSGQVIVDATEDAKIQLVLNGVDITCSGSAAIYVKEADKVFLTINSGTTNTLAVGSEYDSEDENGVDGVIFSKCDLTINGEGTLNIYANYGHGIVAKDDLALMGGIYSITSENHGIRANDSIRIANGIYNITSGKDGIKVSNSDDTSKGYMYILDGTFYINAEQDGITASSTMQLEGGTFTISSGGGYSGVLNTITVGEGSGSTVQATDKLTTSMKAFKANDILVNGGTYNLSCYEDAMHANNESFVINDGTFTIYTGDDAIHSDSYLEINGGTIDIVEGYEGLEGKNITINGGIINVNVLDDAINVSSSSGVMTITGGTITLASSGDGVDSNGSFVMTGGTLILDIDAIYTGGDGEFDITGSITYTGGEIYDENGNELDPNSSSTSSSSGGISFPSWGRR